MLSVWIGYHGGIGKPSEQSLAAAGLSPAPEASLGLVSLWPLSRGSGALFAQRTE